MENCDGFGNGKVCHGRLTNRPAGLFLDRKTFKTALEQEFPRSSAFQIPNCIFLMVFMGSVPISNYRSKTEVG